MFGKRAEVRGLDEKPSLNEFTLSDVNEEKLFSTELGIINSKNTLNLYFNNNDRFSKRKTRSALRNSNFWSKVKRNNRNVRRILCEASTANYDLRPYAEIEILERKILGLLDSGAQVSCIGGSLAVQLIKDKNLKQRKIIVKTADGTNQVNYGFLDLPVKFRKVVQRINFFIVPNFTQNIILGIDFWQKFSIAPNIISQVDITAKQDLNLISLTPDQETKLTEVKRLFPSFEEKGLGRTSLLEHKIEIEPKTKPIKQRYYPISPAVEKLLHQEIDEMISLGVIEEAPNSPWSSPIVLIRKGDKTRLCLDSRKVNNVTIKDAYPLPHIEGILSRLPKAEFITALDLKKAFWQIPLSVESRDLTCFTVPNRPLYRFVVMPFGLCNAPQALCRLMDQVIPSHLRNEVFVYLDDLLIISDSFEKHMKVLAEVGNCLSKSGLTINVSKSKFCVQEVKYLGYVIGKGTLKIDKEKVSAITEFPSPKSTKQLRRFLGMAGWYRRFIDNFASLTGPLTNLLKKSKGFNWNAEAQDAFEKLKANLAKAPILASPDYSRPFLLQCDASKIGVGAVLAQVDQDNNEVPIAFFSKKLNKAQSNYSVTEQECLAVILSLKKFRPYIEGQAFTIITDHASLKWLMSQSDLSGRLARWALKIQGFNFQIQHRRGADNVVPDCLSRLHAEIEQVEFEPSIDMHSEEFKSPEYLNKIQLIQQKSSTFPDLKVHDNKIYKKFQNIDSQNSSETSSWKLWIPKALIPKVLRVAHEPQNKCHGGISKTLERLRINFYWPKMVRDVVYFVKRCEQCQLTKSPNKILRPPMVHHFKACRVFQKLYIDLLGPYPRSSSGHTGILVILDELSKFPLIHPIRTLHALPITKYLRNNVFPIFGTPECIVSDNGKQFKSDQFENLLKARGIRHIFTALYSPQANASERVNRSIVEGIRAYIGPKHSKWDENLSEISEALRSSHHRTIGCSPYFALFGMQMVHHGKEYQLMQQLESFEDERLNTYDKLPLVRENLNKKIQKAFEKTSHQYNLRSSQYKYKIGDLVYRRNFCQSDAGKKVNAKFTPNFVKARVIATKGNSLYELVDENSGKRNTYHGKDIKIAHS